MRENDKTKKEPIYNPPIQAFPLYGLIVCGLIMILIGLYMKFINLELLGYSDGENFHITGTAAVSLGFALLV